MDDWVISNVKEAASALCSIIHTVYNVAWKETVISKVGHLQYSLQFESSKTTSMGIEIKTVHGPGKASLLQLSCAKGSFSATLMNGML